MRPMRLSVLAETVTCILSYSPGDNHNTWIANLALKVLAFFNPSKLDAVRLIEEKQPYPLTQQHTEATRGP